MGRPLSLIKTLLKGAVWFLSPFLVVSLFVVIAVFYLWLQDSATDKTPHERFENLGVIVQLSDTEYIGDCQPTILLVPGSEGGFWGSYDQGHAEQLNALGFHVLKMGYLKVEGLAASFERIEIEPFTRVAEAFSKKYPDINPECVGIIGDSKGSELVLNVASRTDRFKAVVAIVPPSVTFQGKEIGSVQTATSSYQFGGETLPYVPLASSSFEAVQTIWSGELNLFNSGLKNNPSAVKAARIPVENITAPLLLLSAKYDQIWPSYLMSNEIVDRLKRHGFSYEIQHTATDGDHSVLEDRRNWQVVIEFLTKHMRPAVG